MNSTSTASAGGLGLVAVLLLIILMMIVPMPPAVIDIGLALSMGLAVLIFSIALVVERPLDFSSFASFLLISLLIRLALNISSTRLIIGEGHSGIDAAGHVIASFSDIIMGDNLLLGAVIFSILLIVNFVVITKGAGRMAEVGARFALDGMPGRQLAIDSDLSSGAISHEEARERRQTEQQETNFLGSLDGASKFVKGDAVAGLIIVLVNLFFGVLSGTLYHDMEISQAAETYFALTVGDGLVSQVPAVIVSVSAALLLSKGGGQSSIGARIMDELGRRKEVFGACIAMLVLLALVPGVPFLPFFLMALVCAGAFLFFRREQERAEAPSPIEEIEPVETETPIGSELHVDDIRISVARDLVSVALDPASGLEGRIKSIRRFVAADYGFLLPEIRITDDATLPLGEYAIFVFGVRLAGGRVEADRTMVLLEDKSAGSGGEDVIEEPVFRAPARWVSREEGDRLQEHGTTVISSVEVLTTHLLETMKANLWRLFTATALTRQIEQLTTLGDRARAEGYQRFFNEYVPEKVTHEQILGVARELLAEDVPVKNLPLIVEAIAEGRQVHARTEDISEHVRARLGFQTVAKYQENDGRLPLIQLSEQWRQKLLPMLPEGGGKPSMEHLAELQETIGRQVNAASAQGVTPVLAVSGNLRRLVSSILKGGQVGVPVLSFEEIAGNATPYIVSVAE